MCFRYWSVAKAEPKSSSANLQPISRRREESSLARPRSESAPGFGQLERQQLGRHRV